MPASSQPKVVVIGAGAAGVFAAYLLQKLAPNQFDITILEKNDAIGGNARGHEVDWQGQKVHIDCGAQFFFETTEPEYCDMLRTEGFFDEEGLISETAVGMSVWNATTKHLEFAVPNTFEGIMRGVEHEPADWVHFFELTFAAIEKYFSGDWSETFGHWLARIELSGPVPDQEAFKQKIARPLMYQFGLMKPQDLDELSALFVVYYYVGSLPWPEGGAPPKGVRPPIAPFHLYTCNIGLDGILKRLLDNYGLVARTTTRVASIAPQGDGWVVTTDDGTPFAADEIVFATNPQGTLRLLPNTPAFASLRNLLAGMPYLTVPVHVQNAPSSPYISPEKADWTVANVTLVEDANAQASHYMLTIWFGPLKSEPVGQEFFKSWGSPNLVPENQPPPWVLQIHEEVVGTPDFIARRDQLRTAYQGAKSLWYAGGYLLDYDTQNTCLKSARDVAKRLIQKHGFQPPDPGVLAAAGPRIAKENLPPLLLEIERALHALDVSHEVLDAFKARRRHDAGS
jgi:predicted NAD/FAD-binding protein